MKNIIRIILAVILTANFSFSQSYEDIDRNDYKLNLTNISRTSDNSLEFDIYLLNKSSEKPKDNPPLEITNLTQNDEDSDEEESDDDNDDDNPFLDEKGQIKLF